MGVISDGGNMRAQEYVDPNPEYWEDYNNLQYVKHALIREYLNGWLPKLGLWAGRALYIDTHAGRGRHETGELGSPLIAIETFLNHRARDRILATSEIRFVFIERDKGSAELLEGEIETLKPFPPGTAVEVYPGDCADILGAALDQLEKSTQRIAPAFIFVDPYGFKVPGSLLKKLMKYERVELFVNVMWRHLYMGICNARKYAGWNDTLEWILDDPNWSQYISCDDFDICADQAISFLQRQLSAKWVTTVRMLGSNNATEYILAHFTNHDDGRDLMKEVRWKVCPSYSGVFAASKARSPDQLTLIGPEPDRSQLRHWVLGVLATHPTRWRELLDQARSTDWQAKHVNRAVRALRSEGLIDPSDFTGRFSEKSNPLLSLVP